VTVVGSGPPPTWLASAAGLLADRLVGEPPDRLHPVVWFGRWMRAQERAHWADNHRAGVRHAAVGVAGATLAGLVPTALAQAVSRLPRGHRRAATGRRATELVVAVGAAVATTMVVAGRALGEAAGEVSRALDRGGLEEARGALPALVGRDPSRLDEAEIARAVVESVAENTVDAVVAPALWAAAAGAPGALGYRAVNTLDAMVGHRNPRYLRFGWASARLDDVANYVPARVTALLVCACRPARTRDVVRAVVRDAPGHPSPNSGVAEAAFAGALGLRLGGTNRYGERIEVRPDLGRGRPPTMADIPRAVALSRDVTWALAGGLMLSAAVCARLGRSPHARRRPGRATAASARSAPGLGAALARS
jgi:adenosylcobinamide-phosphate synthase